MSISRRTFVQATCLTAATALPIRRARAASEEAIRVGWLAALTGPSSAPALGFDRGVRFAVDTINAAGGVKGRKIEIDLRDTQGDPTKAVNATQEMINAAKVHAIWGPTNSGEALATSAIMARAGVPNMHPCVVDSLIDVKKYPNAFRIDPSLQQWDDAVRHYALKILKAHKVAVISDTTGAGVVITKASAAAFTADGADVVYLANIDSTQPDLSTDMMRAKAAGAEVLVTWSDATGMTARMLNTRATMSWDVPVIGHPALSSGQIGRLIDKPSNWEKVYAVGYRSCSYDTNGKLLAHTEEFLRMLDGKVDLNDTLLWWVAAGYDAIQLVAKAVVESGSTTHKDIVAYWNTLTSYPGYFGTYTFTPEQHNGYPTDDVVMSAAATAHNGAFALAPGYS